MTADFSNGRDLTLSEKKKLDRDEQRVKRGFWGKFRRVLKRIPFAPELLAAYYAARDPQTPAYVRAVLMGALAYFVLPVDMIPDFLLGFGFVDDASVLTAAVAAVQTHITQAHRDMASDWFESNPDSEPPAD